MEIDTDRAGHDSGMTRPSGASRTGPLRRGDGARKNILAGGGALGAIAMSSCCILLLALFSVGVTGAWIGNLAALYPYKLYFLFPTAGFLAAGFYLVYRKPKADACEGDGACAAPISDRINKAVLWGATGLTLAALAFPYYAPLLLES